ncbi:Tetratricopeptide repeat [Phytophthora infestans]|uniref:Tetratricopeptide repeat n=1 Tax=Phytophthora infestans TaxID=4787 RepID=A0A8S9UB83_PHYIN|nr:Tetratricopeptide repeat [Phytophthora infestans]
MEAPSTRKIALDLTPLEASRLKEEEADARIAARDLDGALQCLAKAIFLRPEHAQLYAKRAQVYWELCDIKSAIANYRKLFAVNPDPPQRIKDQLAALLDLHAYSLLCLGESPNIVLGYLNEAIQLNALDEVYWLHRAVANIEAGCFEKAVLDVDHCICLNSRDVEYFVLRAKLHWRLHMQEKANADIYKAALLQPDHPEVLGHEQRLLKESQAIYEQARTQLMAHQFEDAIQNLSRATEITPEETKLYLLRASAFRELGEYHMALRDTEKALSCHQHKRDTVQSEQNLQDNNYNKPAHVPALRLNAERDTSSQYRDIIKQRSLILTDIGIRFLHQKSYQLAVNAMNQAIRSHTELTELFREQFTSPHCFLHRGDAYRGLGNFQAALADYHHALELLPGDQHIQSRVALVHYQFGVELFNRAQFDKAELEFTQAIEQDSNVSYYYVRRGDAARYLDKHQTTCEDYQKALRLNPSDTETLTKLQQYNVAALPTTRNQRTLISSKPVVSFSQSPQQRRSQGNVDNARKSYKKTNQRVQDLFRNRPVVPPPSMNTLK